VFAELCCCEVLDLDGPEDQPGLFAFLGGADLAVVVTPRSVLVLVDVLGAQPFADLGDDHHLRGAGVTDDLVNCGFRFRYAHFLLPPSL